MFEGCTEQCATPVPCPTCGRDLPPRGRSLGPFMNLASCCDGARFSLANTRHIWSVDEIPSSVPVRVADDSTTQKENGSGE